MKQDFNFLMKQEILNMINYRFVYDSEVINKFMAILAVRFGQDSEMYKTLHDFSKKKVKQLPDDINVLEELKRLNQLNLRTRLEFLENNKTPETVIISYLKQLYKELEQQRSFSPLSFDLIVAEDKMLTHLLYEARYNEDMTELEGLNNLNLRLVLQCWLLSPEYLKDSERCHELLECLSISNFNF